MSFRIEVVKSYFIRFNTGKGIFEKWSSEVGFMKEGEYWAAYPQRNIALAIAALDIVSDDLDTIHGQLESINPFEGVPAAEDGLSTVYVRDCYLHLPTNDVWFYGRAAWGHYSAIEIFYKFVESCFFGDYDPRRKIPIVEVPGTENGEIAGAVAVVETDGPFFDVFFYMGEEMYRFFYMGEERYKRGVPMLRDEDAVKECIRKMQGREARLKRVPVAQYFKPGAYDDKIYLDLDKPGTWYLPMTGWGIGDMRTKLRQFLTYFATDGESVKATTKKIPLLQSTDMLVNFISTRLKRK